jgi:hypothetical protein
MLHDRIHQEIQEDHQRIIPTTEVTPRLRKLATKKARLRAKGTTQELATTVKGMLVITKVWIERRKPKGGDLPQITLSGNLPTIKPQTTPGRRSITTISHKDSTAAPTPHTELMPRPKNTKSDQRA